MYVPPTHGHGRGAFVGSVLLGSERAGVCVREDDHVKARGNKEKAGSAAITRQRSEGKNKWLTSVWMYREETE